MSISDISYGEDKESETPIRWEDFIASECAG
jgi:hypothetical protein